MLDLGIQGRRAIVCGSSHGLGRACAAVVVNSIDADRAARAAEGIAAAEFGAARAFLCSAPAAYITGQDILVDGGITTRPFDAGSCRSGKRTRGAPSR
jgi:NAD(P)-dependent dehydrogenase (short-subunit alcohol dehydrogenase family)